MPLPTPNKNESRDAFVARFMSNEQARKDFPDPERRLAVAFRSFRRRQRRIRKMLDDFYVAKAALCCTLSKQDVPEVEAIIRILTPAVEDFWERALGEAVVAAERQLDSLEDELPTASVDAVTFAAIRNERDRTLDILVAVFLSIIEQGSTAQLGLSIEQAIIRSVEELMTDGGRSLNFNIDLAREPAFRQAAREDLRTLLKGRVDTRKREIRRAGREFLTSRRARTPARPGDILDPPRPPLRAASLQQWRQQLREVVGLAGPQWIPQIVDQWAYRWFSIGQFRAARQAGVLEFIARAVLDDRTTPFCRWVDGRRLRLSRLENQVERHIRASIANDIEALAANWPMLPSSIVGGNDRRAFARAFARVGLPPYHFRCRTTVQPARV